MRWTRRLETRKYAGEKKGYYEDDPFKRFGVESRSLRACWTLRAELGYRSVLHLRGGFSRWRLHSFPVADEL